MLRKPCDDVDDATAGSDQPPKVDLTLPGCAFETKLASGALRGGNAGALRGGNAGPGPSRARDAGASRARARSDSALVLEADLDLDPVLDNLAVFDPGRRLHDFDRLDVANRA